MPRSSERPVLQTGPVRLYRMEGAEGDRGTQVATSHDPHDGSVVVMVRFGDVITVLTPEAASVLADGLKVEAAYALVEAQRLGETPPS